MKKFSSPFFLSISFLFVLAACKKINEPTDLGGNLIPPVDNVNTFESYLTARTDSRYLDDTASASFSDNVALGYLNDPDFGTTKADIYFNISRLSYSVPVFDSLVSIDSAVISLAYKGGYGDTSIAQPSLSVRVHEVLNSASPATRFHDTAFYQFDHPDFPVSNELGSKVFKTRSLSDSIRVINKPGDTSKVANVLRIRLSDLSFITRAGGLADTSIKNDSALQIAFKGFGIKADNVGNTLAYFNLSDLSTRLTIYYKGKVEGKDSSLSSDFYHRIFNPAPFPIRYVAPVNFRNGLANLIKRSPNSSPYAANISTPNVEDQVVYLQSAPNGSVAVIELPALDTFSNSVIHLAELIVTKIPSTQENLFVPPSRLFLDRITESPDSSFFFLNDFLLPSNQYDFARFGGTLKFDNTYRFNITRTVQGIVTRDEKNYKLRLHIPYKTSIYAPGSTSPVGFQFLAQPASARVVLAGGNFSANPSMRMRLRLVYSKI